MEDKNFYNRIIEDKDNIDRVIYNLELMMNNAPNPRIRTQAELAKTYLIQVQLICDALKTHNNG